MTGTEMWATVVQSIIFVVGLIFSLAVGIALSRYCDGPGSLLATTILSAAGLLGSAALSQLIRDRIVNGPT